MAAISQQLADITVLSIVVRILLSTFCAGGTFGNGGEGGL